MKKTNLIMVSTLLCVLFSHSCIDTKNGDDGLVTFVEGDVEIMRSDAETFEEIGPGEVFGAGDTIRTGYGSMADIRFSNESALRLKEETTLHIRKYESSIKTIIAKLKLVSGIILCRIEKLNRNSSFEVATRVAVTGIRGTDFMVESLDEESTKVSVLEGEVEVKSTTIEAPPIVIGYHEKTLVYEGSPPRPAEKLLLEEIEQLKEISFINVGVVVKIAKAVASAAGVKQLKMILADFYVTEGAYPQELEELIEKEYLRKLPKDRWGSELYYSISEDGQKYVLLSPGPDGRLGNEDDLKY